MKPVAIANLPSPCLAAALFADGTVMVSGLHCLKPTHRGVLVPGAPVTGLQPTRFGTRCDPSLVASDTDVDAAAQLLNLLGASVDPTVTLAPGDQYECPWACPCPKEE